MKIVKSIISGNHFLVNNYDMPYRVLNGYGSWSLQSLVSRIYREHCVTPEGLATIPIKDCELIIEFESIEELVSRYPEYLL
jgi:hypothetical protein